jgi:hypothetical protein
LSTLPVDAGLIRAAFPDWRIIGKGKRWDASREQAAIAGSHRLAAVGYPEVTASGPVALAIRLAAIEFPLGITPLD